MTDEHQLRSTSATRENREQSYQPFPQWPLQGQVVHALYEGLMRDHLPHALLFTGSTATTRMFAEFFAKLLLCTGQGAPCSACPSCHQVDARNHPDFLHVAIEEGTSIKTAQVEALQSRLKLRSHAQGRTVYFIEGVDKVSPVVANRLLKTLEEPLPGTIALLSAENDGGVLSTIRSRAFLYRLGSGDAGFADPLPDSLTGQADEQNLSFAGLLKPVIQWTQHMLTGGQLSLKLALELQKQTEPYLIEDVLHVLLVWLQDLLHTQLHEEDALVCKDSIEMLRAQAGKLETAQWLRIIETVIDTKRRVSSHVVARLNIEQMCVRMWEVIQSV